MKPQVIGNYEFGYEYVQLLLRDGEGAEFYRLSEDITIPTIFIGADGSWLDIVTRLLHEALEFSLERAGCRFYPTNDLARNTAAYTFSFNHQQFADCCAKVAEFVTAALPDLQKAWKQRG